MEAVEAAVLGAAEAEEAIEAAEAEALEAEAEALEAAETDDHQCRTGKCTKQHATNASKSAKYRSNQHKENQFIAKIAIKK